ncbi:hypothetical protein ACFVP0_29335 [Streptomyces cinereoruber]|uniref:hypothetical protein n=1 Tax=Streptomyces cinereoruber TaxID=67260 RepID=UPI00369A6F73
MILRNLIARREANASAAQATADDRRAAADRLRATGASGPLVDALIRSKEAAAARAQEEADYQRAMAARLSGHGD